MFSALPRTFSTLPSNLMKNISIHNFFLVSNEKQQENFSGELPKLLLHIATLAMFCFLKLPKFLRSELACLFSKSPHSAVCSSAPNTTLAQFPTSPGMETPIPRPETSLCVINQKIYTTCTLLAWKEQIWKNLVSKSDFTYI